MPKPRRFKNNASSLTAEASAFITTSLLLLLTAGAVQEWGGVSSPFPTVVSPLGVVPKANGKLRLILDLRYVNEHLYCPHFKFENLKNLQDVLNLGDLMATIDLQNGYWQMRMHPDFYQYLGFEWNGKYYVFTVLPFGLSTAPWCFQMVMRQFCAHLRSQGFRLLNYLDDFLFLLGTDAVQAKKDLARLLAIFCEFGLIPNWEKCSLSPSTLVKCLGFMVNSLQGTFTVCRTRWLKFVSLVRSTLGMGKVSARALSQVTGHAVSMSLVLGGVCRLFTRYLYALAETRPGWPWGWDDATLVLSDSARQELLFWRDFPEQDLSSPIHTPPTAWDVSVHETINTDASGFGWAGVLGNGDKVAAGSFTSDETKLSSGGRELKAILYTLQALRPLVQGKRVRLLTDSTNACAVTDHGSGKTGLQATAIEIFTLCKEMHASVHISWIRREFNTVADAYSKCADSQCRSLNPVWFRVLDNKEGWGPFSFDRFADHANRQHGHAGPLPFNSLYACPGSSGLDAFAQVWSQTSVHWCHPPAQLIGRLWQFMRVHAIQRAVLLLPVWPSAIWWPLVNPVPGFLSPAVTGVLVLPHEQPDLLLPAEPAARGNGDGCRRWRVWALNLSFGPDWALRPPLPCPL